MDECCMFFAYDVMGQLCFSKSFGMTSTGRFTNEVETLQKCMTSVMVLGNVPYVSSFLGKLPNPLKAFDDYTKRALKERLRLTQGQDGYKEGVPDIFAHLLGEVEPTNYDYAMEELAAEATVICIAGSDTTTTTLSVSLFLLASHTIVLERLRAEIIEAFADQEAIEDFDVLTKQCPLLNAVIDETLRLYPPVATQVQRELCADSEGAQLPLRDGKTLFLSPGTVVILPAAIVHRDPRNFGKDADHFRPDRWLPKTGVGEQHACNRSAFIPFGHGPNMCIGRQLAYMELRIFLANFVTRFNFILPNDFDVKTYEDGMMDNGIMSRLEPLQLQITKRT